MSRARQLHVNHVLEKRHREVAVYRWSFALGTTQPLDNYGSTGRGTRTGHASCVLLGALGDSSPCCLQRTRTTHRACRPARPRAPPTLGAPRRRLDA
eukprot:2910332-Prymnesium_polylepis.1